MNAEETGDYLRVINKLQEAMDGESVDDLIPALATCLAQVGASHAPNKRQFVSYVVKCIDNIFERHGGIH
jgi:hypothetical protein